MQPAYAIAYPSVKIYTSMVSGENLRTRSQTTEITLQNTSYTQLVQKGVAKN